jgi:hypothetical protein
MLVSIRFLSALAFALSLATLPVPQAQAQSGGTPVPTSPPPICQVAKGLPYTCPGSTRSDYYPKVCPATAPKKDVVVCQPPAAAAVPAMSCFSYGGEFDCEAAPWTADQSLTYTWAASGPLWLFQPYGDHDPFVVISCHHSTGGGTVTLTVRNSSGVASSISQYFSCLQ